MTDLNLPKTIELLHESGFLEPGATIELDPDQHVLDSVILAIRAKVMEVGAEGMPGPIVEALDFQTNIEDMEHTEGERIPDPTSEYLALYLREKIGEKAALVLCNIKDFDQALAFAERLLFVNGDTAAHAALVQFLVHVKVVPKDIDPKSIPSPIPATSLMMDFKVGRAGTVRKVMVGFWKSKRDQKELQRIFEEAKKPCEPLTPFHIAATLSHLFYNLSKDVAKMTSTQEAFVRVLHDLYTGGKYFKDDPMLYLRSAGIYPVGEEFPADEKPMRELVGLEIFKVVTAERNLRKSLFLACKDVLPLGRLNFIRYGNMTTDGDPSGHLFQHAIDWLKEAGVENPEEFLVESGVVNLAQHYRFSEAITALEQRSGERQPK